MIMKKIQLNTFSIKSLGLNKIMGMTLLMCFVTLSGLTQEKFSTKSGTIFFDASLSQSKPVPEATNNTVSAILNDNGELTVLVFIDGFKFKKGLMQTHFNQKKFMDSETYPKSKFVGILEGFSVNELSDVKKDYPVSGQITVRGVTQDITTTAKVNYLNNKIYVESEFHLEIDDFNITVKKFYARRVAKTVKVDIVLELKE